MRDFILLNYNLNVKKIYKDCFFVNNEKIKIVKLKKNIDDLDYLFTLSNNLYYKNILVDTFILNKDGICYTKKNDEYIILMKINDIVDDVVELEYLKLFEQENNLKYKNIVEEWKEKIDDLEAKIGGFNNEYSIVQKTVNYYLGMAENAVSLLNETKNINNNSIGFKVKLVEFNKTTINNPFNFFKINKMYNIAIYIKNKIFKNMIDYNELEKIVKEIENKEDEIALFSYMLFPDYYIDIVNEEIKEEEIKKIIMYNKNYKKVLVFLKENMYKSNKLKLFVWLN